MKSQSIHSNNPLYNIELHLVKRKIDHAITSDAHIFRWDKNAYNLGENEVSEKIKSNHIELLMIVDNPNGGMFSYAGYETGEIIIPITKLRGRTTVRLVGIAKKDLSIQTKFTGVENVFSEGEIVIESEVDSNWSQIISSQNTSGEKAVFQIEYLEGIERDEYKIDYDSPDSVKIMVGDENFQINFARLEKEYEPKGRSSQKESLGFMYSVYFPMISEALLKIAGKYDQFKGNDTQWLPLLRDMELINDDILLSIEAKDTDLALKKIHNQICSRFYDKGERDHVLNHFETFNSENSI